MSSELLNQLVSDVWSGNRRVFSRSALKALVDFLKGPHSDNNVAEPIGLLICGLMAMPPPMDIIPEEEETATATTFGDLLDAVTCVAGSGAIEAMNETLIEVLSRVLVELGPIFRLHNVVQLEACFSVLDRSLRDPVKVAAMSLLLQRWCSGAITVDNMVGKLRTGLAAFERHAPMTASSSLVTIHKSVLQGAFLDMGGEEFFLFNSAVEDLVKKISDLLGDKGDVLKDVLAEQVRDVIRRGGGMDVHKSKRLARLISVWGLESDLSPVLAHIPEEFPLHDALIECDVAPAGVKPAKRKQRSDGAEPKNGKKLKKGCE